MGGEPPPDLQGPYLLGLTGVLAGISLLGYIAHRLLRSAHPTLGFGALLVALAFAWYLTSVSFVLINRQVMGGGRKFSFPATLTLQHTFYKGLLALLAVLATNCGEIRSEAAASPAGQGRCCTRARGCCGVAAFGRWITRKYSIDRGVWCKLIAPLAFATAADIFLSNLALRWVSVSLYTVAKSTALIFTYGLSLLLGLQGWSCSLLAAVTGVAAGVVMCSIRPTPVHVLGFIAVIVAAACSAARWVISQRFFERGGTKPSVMVLVLLQSPFTVALMAPLAAMEAPDLAVAAATHSEGDVVAFALMGVLGGLLAFLLLAVELQLIALTSALTANVIGHLKDIVAIAGSVLVLQEELSILNGSGAALTVLSALAYSALKARKAVRARRAGVHSRLDDLEPGLDVGDDPVDAGDAADGRARGRGRSEGDGLGDAGDADSRSRSASAAGTGEAAAAVASGKGAKGAAASNNRYAPVAAATPAPGARDRRLYSIGSDDDDDDAAGGSLGPTHAASPAALSDAAAAAVVPAPVVVPITEPASAVAGDEKRRGGTGPSASVPQKAAAGLAAAPSADPAKGRGAPAASWASVPGKLLRPPPAARAAASAAAAPAAATEKPELTSASNAAATARASDVSLAAPPGSPALAAAVHVAIASLEEDDVRAAPGPREYADVEEAGSGAGNGASSATAATGSSGGVLIMPPSATASSASGGERKQLLGEVYGDHDGSNAVDDDVREEASPARA